MAFHYHHRKSEDVFILLKIVLISIIMTLNVLRILQWLKQLLITANSDGAMGTGNLYANLQTNLSAVYWCRQFLIRFDLTKVWVNGRIHLIKWIELWLIYIILYTCIDTVWTCNIKTVKFLYDLRIWYELNIKLMG